MISIQSDVNLFYCIITKPTFLYHNTKDYDNSDDNNYS